MPNQNPGQDSVLLYDPIKSVEQVERTIDVNTGEVKLARGSVLLRALAIGSCIVVASLGRRQSIAAMAHIMLPGKAGAESPEKTRYAADAIEWILTELSGAGADINNAETFLVGAGNVLQKPDDTICRSNIESVTAILKKKNISVTASVLGGTERKSVFVDVAKGCVWFAEAGRQAKPLRGRTIRALSG